MGSCLLAEMCSIMDRFREDIFKEGEVGGHCLLHKSQLRLQGEHKSALQSWFV
jgi:protein O-GlcNAc transferase